MAVKLSVSYRVNLPELQRDKYIKAVQDACRTALLKAARKFLLAAIPRIPVFTGFAKGAFGNLEDIAGKVAINSRNSQYRIRTTDGGDKKIKSLQSRNYYYYPSRGAPGVLRNNITGRQFATPSGQILDKGKARIAKDQTSLFFKFSVDINYMSFLDRTKWGAFKAGTDAFNIELRDQLDKLMPQIGKYMIRRELK